MTNTTTTHFMRFGIHSEKQYFHKPFQDCYDGVVLNGNLVAYSLKGVCSFISGLLAGKKYFIDPITHAFGHHPQHISQQDSSGFEPKPAIKALAAHYGEPAVKNLGRRALSPDDFNDLKVLTHFTEHVLDFQQNAIYEGMEDSEDAKYFDVAGMRPCFLIAPYFYLGPNSVDLWIDLNMQFIEASAASGRQSPIFAEILIANEAFLDQEVRDRLMSKYANCPAEGILLWVEGFSEHSASSAALKGYRSFAAGLAAAGKNVVIMYGGYYSIILSKYGVSAVCHGPGYGEEREVTPVGGGVPKPKFYYPALHMRMPYRQVAFALSGTASELVKVHQYYQLVCDCRMCREVLANDLQNFAKYGESKSGVRKDGIAFEYATTAAKKIATAHYIYNKKKEFDFTHGHQLAQIRETLDQEYNACKALFGVNEAAHLQAWSNTLQ